MDANKLKSSVGLLLHVPKRTLGCVSRMAMESVAAKWLPKEKTHAHRHATFWRILSFHPDQSMYVVHNFTLP